MPVEPPEVRAELACRARASGPVAAAAEEKERPITTGWSTLAFATDWARPPGQQATTPSWFLMSDQWRYQRSRAGECAGSQ